MRGKLPKSRKSQEPESAGNSQQLQNSGEADAARKNQKSKKQPREKGRKLFYVTSVSTVFIILLLLIYLGTLLSGLNPYFEQSANNNALEDLEKDRIAAEELFHVHYANLMDVARRVSFADSKEAVDQVISSYIGTEQFGDLRYFCRGVEHSPNGYEMEHEQYEQIMALSGRQVMGISDVYFYKAVGLDCLAVYVPVKGSAFVDGVVSILPARKIIDLTAVRNPRSSLVALIATTGKVLSVSAQEDFPYTVGNNYFTFLKSATQNKGSYDTVSQMVAAEYPTSQQFLIDGVSYSLATRPLSGSEGKLHLVSLSLSEVLTAKEMTYIRQIIVMSIMAVAALLVSLFFVFLYHRKATKKLIRSTQMAPELECANAAQFRRHCGDIIDQTQRQKLMVVCAEVRQFSFISSQLGEEATLEVLKYIVKIIRSVCGQFETFGYAEDGNFLMLLRCNEIKEFRNKIKLITNLVGKNELLGQQGMVLGLYIGGCPVNREKQQSVNELVEYATQARNMAKSELQQPYIIYTDAINENLRKNDRIEAQMEEALKNREFKLFLQPKYNVRRDCVDSAEALVRWFDPRKNAYVFPVEFIPLFETNGFITKLDHFMFLEVCNYFKSAAEHGDKIIPIAVNVSRVTAIQQDFLEFYIGNKKRYGIADGFLTIEFTESFAMQNYEVVYEIVDQLHKNGIRCSIDDFGSGYSSFSILKSIPMDELKSDSIFINDGLTRERDDLILKTVIKLGKDMGMSVVQEGVETKEVFDRVCAMGCDVIQGYYYARAIPLEEFRLFINTNTSIRYKAVVK